MRALLDGLKKGPRLREYCRQFEAEVVSNSRNKIHQTWQPLLAHPCTTVQNRKPWGKMQAISGNGCAISLISIVAKLFPHTPRCIAVLQTIHDSLAMLFKELMVNMNRATRGLLFYYKTYLILCQSRSVLAPDWESLAVYDEATLKLHASASWRPVAIGAYQKTDVTREGRKPFKHFPTRPLQICVTVPNSYIWFCWRLLYQEVLLSKIYHPFFWE